MKPLPKDEFTAFVGIDWADVKHDICLQAAHTDRREFDRIEHKVDGIEQWAISMKKRFGGPIAIALELAKGPLVYALQKYDFFVLFPINPATLAKYREAFKPSGAKDDPTDAELALELLTHHRDRLTALDPQSVRSSVAKRLGLDVQGAAPAARDVEGLLDVLGDAACNFNADLTLERLCGWHAALFPSGYSGLHRIEVAKLRTSAEAMQIVSGPVGRQTIHFQAPAAADLPREMERFVQWFNASSQPQEGPASDASAQPDGLVRAGLAQDRKSVV